MSLASKVNPDRPEGESENTFLLLSSAEMLGNKVNTLLRVIKEVEPLARVPNEDAKGYVDQDERDLSPELDGSIRSSAESTLIRACARLDQIIDDDDNWEISVADRVLDKRIAQLHRYNLAAAKERVSLIQNQNRASYRNRAKLFRDGDTFYAVIGDHWLDEGAIVGKGSTGEEALTNLDAILTSKPKTSDES